MRQMYKVFVNEKPVIICGDYEGLSLDANANIVFVTSRREMKHAFRDFTKSMTISSLVLYNKGSAKKLLKDFISLFWYLEAAGGIVRNTHEQRLFIYRFNKWDLPKGKIEKNETPAEAALREVSEETGLNGQSIIAELPSTYHIYEYKGKRIFKRTFWYAMQYNGNQTLVPQLEEEITEAAWFQETALEKVLANTYQSLLDLINEDLIFKG